MNPHRKQRIKEAAVKTSKISAGFLVGLMVVGMNAERDWVAINNPIVGQLENVGLGLNENIREATNDCLSADGLRQVLCPVDKTVDLVLWTGSNALSAVGTSISLAADGFDALRYIGGKVI